MADAANPPKQRTRTWRAPHLLASSDPLHALRIFRRYWKQIDRRYLPRALSIPTISLLHSPLSAVESLLMRRRIAKQRLAEPLVIIIGHWRSGTTNVHNHLLQDPRFGYVSLLHCLAPHGFLTYGSPLKRMLRPFIGDSRPMDRVPHGLDAPMSEDFAMVGVSESTAYLGYFFPRLLEETFRETVFFEGLSEKAIARWAADLEWILKKVTADCEGRPLVLKNPTHTGRIRHLVQHFPQARYVFVRRNPYVVHASTCRLMERFLTTMSLQEYDIADVERAVLKRQSLLLERYFEDRHLIPEGHLVEIQHENMVDNPLETIESVYRGLDLGGFEDARPRLQSYIESLSGYRNNEYQFAPEQVAAVTDALEPILTRWQYEPPSAP